jgi:gamma-glutamylcyclotransferase (GGCT)/AIG2-like uncharacterized protein YtfP
MEEKTRVFVYGTLKNGYGNHRILQQGEADFIGEDTVYGITLYMPAAGSYPTAVRSKGRHVHGEVYEVDARTFRHLDGLEGYPYMYDRTEVQTKGGHTVWVYVAPSGGIIPVFGQLVNIGSRWDGFEPENYGIQWDSKAGMYVVGEPASV